MTKRLIPALLILTVSLAQAQSYQAEGDYRSSEASLKTIMLDLADGTMAATTTVTLGACSGVISGIGKLKGTVLDLSPYRPDKDAGSCTLRVEFSKDFKRATLTADGCTAYSGSSCGWEGQVVNKKR